MIKISKSTDKEVKEFGEKQWPHSNIEHYGKNVNYNQKDFVFKATENGKVVGSIKGSHEAGVLYITYLIVDNKKRGLGIGKLLTKKSKEFGKKMEAHKIHLITGKDWKATKFYESLGYKKVAELPKHHFEKDFAIYEKFI